MIDLFNSVLDREQLVDVYVDVHSTVRGFAPYLEDVRKLGRATLVDLIERLDEEAKSKRNLFDLV